MLPKIYKKVFPKIYMMLPEIYIQHIYVVVQHIYRVILIDMTIYLGQQNISLWSVYTVHISWVTYIYMLGIYIGWTIYMLDIYLGQHFLKIYLLDNNISWTTCTQDIYGCYPRYISWVYILGPNVVYWCGTVGFGFGTSLSSVVVDAVSLSSASLSSATVDSASLSIST